MVVRLFICCLLSTTLIGQSNLQLANQAISAAKEGTMLVVIEQFEKNIAALEKKIEIEDNEQAKVRLTEQIDYKRAFSKLYETSANYAFERFYTFGKYQLVPDTELKAMRKTLEAEGEPYLIYKHTYTSDEFVVINSDNARIPKPFPQEFDGILAQMKTMLSDADENIEVYKQFFSKSIFTLNRKLDYQYNKVGYKYQRKEFNKMKWLLGTWKMEDKPVYERWVKAGRGMVGQSYQLVKKQKETLENIELYFKGQDLVYVVSDVHPEPMIFQLKTQQKKSFTIENLDNDFPKTITYRLDGKYLKVDLKNESRTETLSYLWESS